MKQYFRPSTIDRPDFPLAFDATMIRTFRECPQKFFWEYLCHWKARRPSIHLHAGAAFASALEKMRESFWIDGNTSKLAVEDGLQKLISEYGDFECPAGIPKTLENMCGAFLYLADTYPLGMDGTEPISIGNGRRGIEFSIALPLDDRLRHPITNDPILYTGRCDQIIHYNGAIFLEDDKTTSQLGPRWGEQWEMRSQFTGYTWAARQAFENVQGVLVTGIAIRKTGFDHARSLTYRTPAMIDRWHEQTIRDILRARKMWEDGYFDYNLDESCCNYGSCTFINACKSEDPEPWLKQDFQVRIWNPLTRVEETVGELL